MKEKSLPALRSPLIRLLLLLLISTAWLFGQTAPGDPNAVPVEFRFIHYLTPPDSGCGVNGAMNNWLNGVYKMKLVAPNDWRVTLDLLPLTYEYKLVTYTDTVGQAGVTAYFSDSLNPKYGGPFNNSYMAVKNPMIYYFLPKDGSQTSQDKPTITAKIAVSNSSHLAVNRIIFKIDNTAIANAQQYYDSTKHLFSYTPTTSLSSAQHSAYLKVYNTAGDSADLTTTFRISGFYSTGSYTFYVDTKSPNFEYPNSPVTRIDLKGDFNSGGNSTMSDPDSDGVYTYTTNLNLEVLNEYTVIVNSGYYMNDPDNPNLSPNHRTFFIKHLMPYPEYRSFTPPSCQVYPYPIDTVIAKARIYKSDSVISISANSLTATYDGTTIPVDYIIIGGGVLDIQAKIANPTVGRHVIKFFAADLRNNPAKPVTFAFGIYPSNTGFHAIDNDEDDKGNGSYAYPTGVPDGSADIQEMTITAPPTNDSLSFQIKMKSLSDYTRLGLLISNQIDGFFTEAMQNVKVEIPEWNNRGVYIILAKPGTASFNGSQENILFRSRDPLQTSVNVPLDAASLANGIFKFSLPLSVLEDVMGTYHDKWYFSSFSYLKDQNGVMKVTSALGGSDAAESPNVYDFGFCADQKVQQRLITNFIPYDGIGGPRLARLGSIERGSIGVTPAQISSTLSQVPDVEVYASGGDLVTDTVSVNGYADMPAGSTVTLHVNNTTMPVTTNANKQFSKLVTLGEGTNKIYAEVMYNTRPVHSKTIAYNYIKDHKPAAKISLIVNGGSLMFDGSQSTDPDGGSLTYKWSQDTTNPQQLSIPVSSVPTFNINKPVKKGEYYFTLTVTNNSQLKGWARTVALVTDTGAYSPDMTTFHSAWIDSAVIYSIFVRTFDASGKFKAVTDRMAELKDLGIDCLWFLPIYPTTNDHGPDNPGYAVTNYLDVLPDYGTQADFAALVNKAHQYGIRVILDQVIQHTADVHPFMLDANKYKQNSPYYPFYMWDNNNNFIYLFTWTNLPSINYDAQSTRDYLIRMAKYWVQDFNIDGYRCDVAWAIDSLRAQGPAFWKRWRQELKSIKPDMFALAEADVRSVKIFDGKFDAAYDGAWFDAIRSISSGTYSINALDSVINMYKSSYFPKHMRPFKFLENQDQQRFIDQFGVANTRIAAALMFTVPGIPHLYAGQEVGELTYRGNIDWTDPSRLRPFYKGLIAIRKQNPALAAGNYVRVDNSMPTQIYSFLRVKDTNNAVMVFNFGSISNTATIRVPISQLNYDTLSNFYLNDVYNNKSYLVNASQLSHYQITLESKSLAIFILSKSPLTEVEDKVKVIPAQFSLLQNYPNPFNPSTTIRYDLPQSSFVKVTLYNVLGQRIDELVNREEYAGLHSVVFNGERLASGIYFYQIEAKPLNGGKEYRAVKKMILMK